MLALPFNMPVSYYDGGITSLLVCVGKPYTEESGLASFGMLC